jgi:predicted DNA-binding transcriptional regulator AlpA
MRLSDLADLAPTLTTEQAAEIYGCGIDHLWKLAREGAAPVEPLRLGRSLRWPTVAVLSSIGLDPEAEAPGTVVVPMHRNTGT